jgi:hypothetical protein
MVARVHSKLRMRRLQKVGEYKNIHGFKVNAREVKINVARGVPAEGEVSRDKWCHMFSDPQFRPCMKKGARQTGFFKLFHM